MAFWGTPANDDGVNSEIHSESMIEQVWRCNWRSRLSQLRDALGCHNRASLDMNSEAVIERVWKGNWRPRSSDLEDTLRGRNWASLEMHLEAMIKWTQRCTPRVWLSEFGHTHVAGYDRARLEESLDWVDFEAVDRRWTLCWDSIPQLVNIKLWECEKVASPFKC